MMWFYNCLFQDLTCSTLGKVRFLWLLMLITHISYCSEWVVWAESSFSLDEWFFPAMPWIQSKLSSYFLQLVTLPDEGFLTTVSWKIDYILYLVKKKNQRKIKNLKHEPIAVYPAQLTEDHKVKVTGKPVSSPLTDANFHFGSLCSDIVITGSFSVDQIFFFK